MGPWVKTVLVTDLLPGEVVVAGLPFLGEVVDPVRSWPGSACCSNILVLIRCGIKFNYDREHPN